MMARQFWCGAMARISLADVLVFFRLDLAADGTPSERIRRRRRLASAGSAAAHTIPAAANSRLKRPHGDPELT